MADTMGSRAAKAATPLPDDMLITVCSACLQATCWQGEFYCDDYKIAGPKDLPVSALVALGREHPSWWMNDPRAQEYADELLRQGEVLG